MKHIRKVFLTAITTLAIFSAIVYSSCHKDPCNGVACLNGGACSQGSCLCPSGYTGSHCQYTTVTYYNNTYTPIYITINGSNATIPVGGSVTYNGTPGDYADGSAYTSGQTGSGSQIGVQISWNLTGDFPQIGDNEVDINVSSDYFFLRLRNASPYNISQEYVNYQLASQTFDNVFIPNDGNIYDMGYYKAFSNSNIYLTSASGWIWSSGLSLDFTSNQHYLFTAY
jgi:hypothetical protein